MTERPLITLIIPFYNHINFVDDAVRSALAQDYPNCELVFSDDCSTDGTGERIRELVAGYRGPHKIIVNINDCNLGLGAHMAKIFSLCNGEWIVTQGGDDVALPNRISVIATYAKRYPRATAIGVSAFAIDENGVQIGESHCVDSPVIYNRIVDGSGPVSMSLNPGDNVSFAMIIGAMAAYRRDVINFAKFNAWIGVEDLYLCWRAILLGDIVFAPERCAMQRINPKSLTRNMRKGGSRRMRREKRRQLHGRIYSTYQSLLEEAKEYPLFVPKEWLCAVERYNAIEQLILVKRGPVSLNNVYKYYSDFETSGMKVRSLWKMAFRLGSHWQLVKMFVYGCVAGAFRHRKEV